MLDRIKYVEFLELMPVCCVDVIIHVGKSFLLIKRIQEPMKGGWWFPGGRIFKNELLTNAVIRKAKDEVGLDVIVEKQVNVYDTIFDTSHFGVPVHTVNVVFLSTPVYGNFYGVSLDLSSSEYIIIDNLEGCNSYVRRAILNSGVLD